MDQRLILLCAVPLGLAVGFAWSAFAPAAPAGVPAKRTTIAIPASPEERPGVLDLEWAARSSDAPASRAERAAGDDSAAAGADLQPGLDRFSANDPLEEEAMPRELIDTGTDKRFVRRDRQGRFSESDDVGRSLGADRRTRASTKAKKGEGDRGDR